MEGVGGLKEKTQTLVDANLGSPFKQRSAFLIMDPYKLGLKKVRRASERTRTS